MRIRAIEFENFRNFKERGKIKCSMDGKVTIIYGKNGDGKTTLHQLFQWVFYGQVHFNKTSTEHLYNLEFERNQQYNSVFEVMGRIDFVHDGKQYSLTRTNTYRKELEDSQKIGENVTLNQMDDDNNWRRVDRPTETIEKLLPFGLAEYFFFDGESMIADLRVKGRDSAAKLRKALYSMFDLDVIESALSHIGRTDLKTTALGKLYLSQGTIASGSKISAVKTNIENAQNKISLLDANIEATMAEKERNQEIVRQASEKIGSSKSKADYEIQRKSLRQQSYSFLNSVKDYQEQFGNTIMEMFPPLLLSKAINDASEKLQLKVAETKLPAGVNKRLISYLLAISTTECVCGNPLCEKEREHIRSYLSLLPPKSYTSMYQEFVKTAEQMGRGYDENRIETIIGRVVECKEQAEKCDMMIRELDEQEKKSPNVEDLIVARQRAEEEIKDLDTKILKVQTEKGKYSIYLKQQMRDFEKLVSENESNIKIAHKIDILKEVASYFENKLDEAAKTYSEKLQENIQYLLNCMLTSRRTVDVSKEFAVRVTDSYNDESKSEGQFAVVSFAYIGGILKMLQSEEDLREKEYPLILDGPFSKLDPDQRQNVVNTIPQFGPQVIIFSKDDLHDVFDSDAIGRVWTIVSNEEKNVARVEEGNLWR